MVANRLAPTSGTGAAFVTDLNLELTALFNAVPLPLSNIGGTANAITADVTPPLSAGLVDGMSFWLEPVSDITAAATLTITGGGTKDIVDSQGAASRKGLMLAAGKYLLHYDATMDQLIVANGNTSIGKQSLYIRADQMVSRTTAGPADGTVETTTNKVMLKTKDYDAGTEEYAQFSLLAPKRWNEGTMTAVFVWRHAATTVNFGVVWGIQGQALSDNDAGDAAFGTAVTVTDTGGVTNNIYKTSETSAFTLGGTPQENDWLVFQVYRKAADVADTMTIDAGLLGVMLYWTSDAANEA